MKDFIKLVFKFTIILFVLAGIVLVSVVCWSKISGKEPQELFSASKEPKMVLLAGLHPDGPLTDFIMIAKYNPKTGKINAMSIPRDTKVVGTVDGKINSAYAKKRDIEALEDKIKDITGLKFDNYVLFETSIVQKVVDEIGGIPMDVPIDMDYDDNEQNLHIHLKKGYQVLYGSEAEQFIRFRKNNDGTGYANGDVQRIQVQQEFIKAAVSEVLKPANLLKLPDLMKLVLNSVKTNITVADVLRYLDEIKNFSKDNLRLETLPGEGKYIGTVSYYVYDSEKTKKLVEEMFINDAQEIAIAEENSEKSTLASSDKITDKSKIRVEVLNGTTRSGLANSVATKLKEDGYNVTKIGNNGNTDSIKTTIINRTSADYATDIKTFLGKGTTKREEDESLKVDVTVILGSDY